MTNLLATLNSDAPEPVQRFREAFKKDFPFLCSCTGQQYLAAFLRDNPAAERMVERKEHKSSPDRRLYAGSVGGTGDAHELRKLY